MIHCHALQLTIVFHWFVTWQLGGKRMKYLLLCSITHQYVYIYIQIDNRKPVSMHTFIRI